MTLFDDREKAYEAEYRQEQETAFRIMVRRDKLLGLWAAERLGLTGEDALAYAKGVIARELGPGGHDLAQAIFTDLAAKGVGVEEADIQTRLLALHEVAREQVLAEIAGRSA